MISARKARLRMALAALFVAATAAGAEEYTFDASAFEKKPFEIGGYVQLKQENYSLNPSGAYYSVAADRKLTHFKG